MLLLALAMCLVQDERGKIIEQLTPDEVHELAQLTDVEKRVFDATIRGTGVSERINWRDLQKDQLFYTSAEIKVNQITSENTFLGAGNNVMYSGIDTSNLADDTLIQPERRLWLCTGNTTYTTVTGATRTVMAVEAVDGTKGVEFAKKVFEARGYRLFQLGNDYLPAKVVKVLKSRVIVLEIGAKKRSDILVESLSAADKAWHAEELQKSAKK